jgi:xanthine dehydrogenase iron-sulfur cluster and FAD-binding subunit A
MWHTYYQPTTLSEALALLSQHGEQARVIAGGTDLILELERGVRGQQVLIDITRIPGLDSIALGFDTAQTPTQPAEGTGFDTAQTPTQPAEGTGFDTAQTPTQPAEGTGFDTAQTPTQPAEGEITLGPLVTHNDVAASPLLVARAFPLAQACWEVGAPQIRNRGTVAGNLITASPANDTITPLWALEGAVTLTSAQRGSRRLPFEQFFLGVRRTAMQPDEMLTAIHLRALPANARGAFIKLGLRRAQAISLLNVAVVLDFDQPSLEPVSDPQLLGPVSDRARNALGPVSDPQLLGPVSDRARNALGPVSDPQLLGPVSDRARNALGPVSDPQLLGPVSDRARNAQAPHVTRARITLGAVAPTIVRAEAAEASLLGRPLSDAAIAEAAALAMQAARPIDDLRASADYRRAMVGVLVERALRQLRAGVERASWPAHPVLLRAPGDGDRLSVIGDRSPFTVHRSPFTARRSSEPASQGHRLPFTLNGQPVTLEHAAGKTLLAALREDGHMTGVKEGCAEGECGACTVWLDGEAVMACLVPAERAAGCDVVTVEGLAQRELHPLQAAFVAEGAVQCGYCTPGLLMSGAMLLEERPDPSVAEIQQALAGNLCRCTGYAKVIAAIEKAGRQVGK